MYPHHFPLSLSHSLSRLSMYTCKCVLQTVGGWKLPRVGRVGCPALAPRRAERVRSCERSARHQVPPNATTRRTSGTVHSEIRPMPDHRRWYHNDDAATKHENPLKLTNNKNYKKQYSKNLNIKDKILLLTKFLCESKNQWQTKQNKQAVVCTSWCFYRHKQFRWTLKWFSEWTKNFGNCATGSQREPEKNKQNTHICYHECFKFAKKLVFFYFWILYLSWQVEYSVGGSEKERLFLIVCSFVFVFFFSLLFRFFFITWLIVIDEWNCERIHRGKVIGYDNVTLYSMTVRKRYVSSRCQACEGSPRVRGWDGRQTFGSRTRTIIPFSSLKYRRGTRQVILWYLQISPRICYRCSIVISWPVRN